MKILLLGGTGAMGRPLSEKLLEEGNDVWITTRSNRYSDNNRLHYLVGNAQDLNFLQKVISCKPDAIVDFMHYSSFDFKNRYKLLLESTHHYFFFSSSRVFADNNGNPIDESSTRLIDTNVDEELIKTEGYAISKALCEEILFNSSYSNWTIIRPYITFGHNRLQLGNYEIGEWLNRAFRKKSIVLPREILKAKTTLTYGGDVAECIAMLIGNEKAKKKALNISSNAAVTWEEIAQIYNEVFIRELGYGISIESSCSLELYTKIFYTSRWQIKYDRCYNRCFNCNLIEEIIGRPVSSGSVHEQIDKTLSNAIHDISQINYSISPVAQACIDRITDDRTELKMFNGIKARGKYLVVRSIPIPMKIYLNIDHKFLR